MSEKPEPKTVCRDCDGDGEAPRSLLGACLVCPTCNGTGELPRGDEPAWVDGPFLPGW
jgi:DnaJ-class molecular chaperone